MPSAAQKRYWGRLVADGCLICGSPAEIAHAHGGSIVERMQEPKARGKKLDRMNWLVLPLCPYHGRNSNESLDVAGPAWWEAHFGKQAAHIDRLAERYGIPLWALASKGRK
jgi:hypothetical protein